MIFGVGLVVQLCWSFSFLFLIVQCQLTVGDAIASTRPEILRPDNPTQASKSTLPVFSLRLGVSHSRPATFTIIASPSPPVSIAISTITSITRATVSTSQQNPSPTLAVTESVSTSSAPVVGAADSPESDRIAVGLWVGLGLGSIFFAGVFGLWRRRQIQRGQYKTFRSRFQAISKRFSDLKARKGNQEDQDWSTESISEVSINRTIRTQSMSTISQTFLWSPDASRPATGADGGELVPPRRTFSLPITAPGSHPDTPNSSTFPTPSAFPIDVKADGSMATGIVDMRVVEDTSKKMEPEKPSERPQKE